MKIMLTKMLMIFDKNVNNICHMRNDIDNEDKVEENVNDICLNSFTVC